MKPTFLQNLGLTSEVTAADLFNMQILFNRKLKKKQKIQRMLCLRELFIQSSTEIVISFSNNNFFDLSWNL